MRYYSMLGYSEQRNRERSFIRLHLLLEVINALNYLFKAKYTLHSGVHITVITLVV